MSAYTDVYIGFITKENIGTVKRKKENTDVETLNKLYRFFQHHCILQYCYDNSFEYKLCVEPCWFCEQKFKGKILVYYQGNTRFIFSEYLYHNIRFHQLEVDKQLLEIIGSITLTH